MLDAEDHLESTRCRGPTAGALQFSQIEEISPWEGALSPEAEAQVK
ncbi:hypothetical protein ACVINU_007753 [Bradyrhizobium diazoefficiens]